VSPAIVSRPIDYEQGTPAMSMKSGPHSHGVREGRGLGESGRESVLRVDERWTTDSLRVLCSAKALPKNRPKAIFESAGSFFTLP
jgi:hypothetical protein